MRFDDFGVRWRGPLAARPAQSGTAFESVGESVGVRWFPWEWPLAALGAPRGIRGFRGVRRFSLWDPWVCLVSPAAAVSRRSKPSSRSLLAGEQSDTLGLLHLNDRKSRHRRIKKQRRYERLAATSQLSLW